MPLSLYSLDILTPEDALYVPFAKSLLDRAKAYMRTDKNMKFFTKNWAFSDVTILIRIWPEGEYIQIRAGKPGEYLVAPFVKQISTVTTTGGTPCFLNDKLTEATEATDFATALAVTSRVSMFPHKAGTKRVTGAVDTSPSTRGFFKKQIIEDAGNAQLASYAGIFSHYYTDPVSGNDLSEYIHGRATVANPTTNAADGFYYHTAALGDFLFPFNSVAIRRPAIHESMFASPNGKKLVTEEQFFAGNTLGYAAWFIERSIIDVDLGAGVPVAIYNSSNLGPYPASMFEARGSGSLIVTTDGLSTAGAGTFIYPVSTALDAGANLIHTLAEIEVDNLVFFENTVAGDTTTFRRRIHRGTECTISAEGMASLTMLLADATQNVEFTDTVPPGTLAMLSPLVRDDFVGSFRVEYSDASLPAIVCSYSTSRVTANPVQALVSSPNNDIIATANHNTKMIRNVAIIGAKVIVISEEETESDTGTVTYVNARTGDPLFATNAWRFGDSNITLPSASAPNTAFCPNRGLDVARTPARQAVQFAAHSKKSYIGSAALSHDPANPTDIKQYVFSHDDAALKKTIVNYVLAPGTPIEGAALDDYEIWFTAIRAI